MCLLMRWLCTALLPLAAFVTVCVTSRSVPPIAETQQQHVSLHETHNAGQRATEDMLSDDEDMKSSVAAAANSHADAGTAKHNGKHIRSVSR